MPQAGGSDPNQVATVDAASGVTPAALPVAQPVAVASTDLTPPNAEPAAVPTGEPAAGAMYPQP